MRSYDAKGEQLWRDAVPGAVWAVNISGDGRLVVAAYGDGTIRWHRMDDGKELLAFFPLPDRSNWVAWTPDGFYAATPGAHGVLRWHVNHGWDAPGEAIPVSDIAELRRPEVLPLVLQEKDIVQALGLAELDKARKAVQLRTNSGVGPGAQLYVLAIGIDDYNEEHAKQLRLNFAAADAWDVASALLNTQGSLYAKVNPQVLRDKDANRAGILRALDTIEKAMQKDDVAVIDFSGHGALIDGKLYLLPYEVDARDAAGIKGSAIAVADLAEELRALGERGRVLVLLDACHSGATTMDGAAMTVNAGLLRAALATTNVTVLTSSSGSEVLGRGREVAARRLHRGLPRGARQPRRHQSRWRHQHDRADPLHYRSVPRLVHQLDPKREQNPGVEMRFERTIFAAGL